MFAMHCSIRKRPLLALLAFSCWSGNVLVLYRVSGRQLKEGLHAARQPSSMSLWVMDSAISIPP